jgi:acetyltransferase-like isoleucine patch superfamily enzyme
MPLKKLARLRDRMLGPRFALRRRRTEVDIAASARLQPDFGIDFLATPERRLYVRAGDQSMLNARIVFESAEGFVEIGARTYFGGGSIICRDRVTIGNDVTIAWGVCIYDHDSNSLDWQQRAKAVRHFYDHHGRQDCYDSINWSGVASAPIVIEDRAWIGFDAVILKGVRIGEGAVVGARSVVTHDVDPYTVVAGNPARFIKRIES